MSALHDELTLVSPNIMTPDQYDKVREWRESNGGVPIRAAGDALKCLEEVLELCYVSGALVAEVDNIVAKETYKALQRGEAQGQFNKVKAAEEAGDVAMCLAAFLQKWNIDGRRSVRDCLEKVRDRKWVPNEDGVLMRPDRIPPKMGMTQAVETVASAQAPTAPRRPMGNPGGGTD